MKDLVPDGPKLLSESAEFPAGYGPRSLRLARSRTEIFVGCKDGTITRVDLRKAREHASDAATQVRAPVRDASRPVAVRALCELDDDWLILGHDTGLPTLLRWNFEQIPQPLELTLRFEVGADSSPQDRGVTSIEHWDAATLLISFRHRSALLVPMAEIQKQLGDVGRQARREVVCTGARPLDAYAVNGMTPAVAGAQTRTLISKDGRVWTVHDTQAEELQEIWEGFDPPGFVFDVAIDSQPVSEGFGTPTLYLTSDQGVFRLTTLGETSEERRGHPRLDRVYLSGIAGMPLAIALSGPQLVAPYRLLWVSNLGGDIHLFWRDAEQDKSLRWRRTGIREGSYPVMRAVATSWDGGPEVVIGQACRNDLVVVTWYERYERAPAKERKTVDILSWGRLEELPSPSLPTEEPWHTAARVADLIEKCGEDPLQLRRFLRNPGTDLALAALAEIQQDFGASGEQAVIRALKLWAHTMLGTVHRRLRRPEQPDFLGIIRWLRRIAADQKLGSPAVVAALKTLILYTRKWGLFGYTYADRPSIHSALLPHDTMQTYDRQFEQLVYRSRLFGQMVDLEVESPQPRSEAMRTPWDLKTLALGRGACEITAVSWNQFGVEVYERRHTDNGWSAWGELSQRRQESPSREGEPPRHSRCVVLGNLRRGEVDHAYLIEAPARASGGGEMIVLRWLDERDAPPCELPIEGLFDAPQSVREPGLHESEEESVYSLCAVASDVILVGLKGIRGIAHVCVMRIIAGRTLAFVGGPLSLPSIHPPPTTPTRNPVWSIGAPPLPRDGDGDSGEANASPYEVVVGCGDGQIFRLCLSRSDLQFLAPPEMVGRLGSPVRALACHDADETDEPERVFAGGADGTIVAFERLRRAEPQKAGPSFVPLWATREEGSINRIHLIASDPATEGRYMVLAITQRGMAVLFSNRPRADVPDPSSDLVRPFMQLRARIPGARLGRVPLGGAAFGSDVLPTSPAEAKEGQVAKLAVASPRGTVRVVGLYYPKHTTLRHTQFRELWKACETFLHDDSHEAEVCAELLRRPESVYVAAPVIATGLVRWILQPKNSEKPWADQYPELPAPAQQWIPRHLRWLVVLDRAWCAGGSLCEPLRMALNEARGVGDTKLFKEILAVVLLRANRQLIAQAAQEQGDASSSFQELLECLGDVRAAWLGEPANLDVRMRITIAKHLLDGETLYMISQARMDVPSRFAVAVAALTRWVQSLLAGGDPLLDLETLRSINIALARACARLMRRHADSGWSAPEKQTQLDWPTLSGIFEAIGDYAARVTHSRGGMGEAVAYEVCRAYALGVLACPTVAVRLASWMGEADLPLEIRRAMLDQVRLLERILRLPMPAVPFELLRVVAGLCDGRDLLSIDHRGKPIDIALDAVGQDNSEIIEAVQPFEAIVVWLRELARQLAEEAGAVDLETGRHLCAEIQSLGVSHADAAARRESPRSQMRHSQEFWARALKDLFDRLDRYPDLVAKPGSSSVPTDGIRSRNVRPELVLRSGTIANWCRDTSAEINAKKGRYEIFEPHSSLYLNSLQSVQLAAARFREGAALQKNIVLGVFGHNLLESLDEHLLDLWEMAQALDPQRVWANEDGELPSGNSKTPPIAGWFADTLLELSLDAATIPKNLRTLQNLLASSRDSGIASGGAVHGFRALLTKSGNEWWSIPGQDDILLRTREFHYLRMVVGELAQNERTHSSGAVRRPNGTEVQITHEAGRDLVTFPFHLPKKKRAEVSRFLERSENLQQPVERSESFGARSHGTGLYLANLLASVVGWKLSAQLRDEKDLVFLFSLDRRL